MAHSRLATMVPDWARPAAGEDGADQAVTLFDAHAASLYRFARVLVHTPEDAEDVVQTSFVRLLHHLKTGGDRSNLRAWLFAVAANLCRDQLRRRRRWLPWLLEDDLRAAAPPDPDAEDAGEVFVRVMRRLPARDRMLLALRAQGLSYRQIAAAAGIRETSVGRLLARAVERWRREREAAQHT